MDVLWLAHSTQRSQKGVREVENGGEKEYDKRKHM